MIRRFALALLLVLAIAGTVTVKPASAQGFRPGDASMIPSAEAALRSLNAFTADFTFQNVAQFNTGRLFVDRGRRWMRGSRR